MKYKLHWKKVASVTHGGQPHFWICLINGIKKYSVVWDRCTQKWAVTNASNVTLAHLGTAAKGKCWVEIMEQIAEDVKSKDKFDYEAIRKFMDAPPNEPRPIGF